MTRDEALEQLRRLPPILRGGKEPLIGWWEAKEWEEGGAQNATNDTGLWLTTYMGLELLYRGKNKMDHWRISGSGEGWEAALSDLRSRCQEFVKNHLVPSPRRGL